MELHNMPKTFRSTKIERLEDFIMKKIESAREEFEEYNKLKETFETTKEMVRLVGKLNGYRDALDELRREFHS